MHEAGHAGFYFKRYNYWAFKTVHLYSFFKVYKLNEKSAFLDYLKYNLFYKKLVFIQFFKYSLNTSPPIIDQNWSIRNEKRG